MDTVTVYLDEDFVCHAEPGEGRTAYETEFFVGQEEIVPLYRIVPLGATWTRADGAIFHGEMIAPV